MLKYDLHIYAACRIKVFGVEADSPVEACRKAEKETDLYHALRAGQAEFDDDIHGFLADELDDHGERIAEYDLTAIPLSTPVAWLAIANASQADQPWC